MARKRVSGLRAFPVGDDRDGSLDGPRLTRLTVCLRRSRGLPHGGYRRCSDIVQVVAVGVRLVWTIKLLLYSIIPAQAVRLRSFSQTVTSVCPRLEYRRPMSAAIGRILVLLGDLHHGRRLAVSYHDALVGSS
jgi:hypothetical protein